VRMTPVSPEFPAKPPKKKQDGPRWSVLLGCCASCRNYSASPGLQVFTV
jgi:hypothetical protein